MTVLHHFPCLWDTGGWTFKTMLLLVATFVLVLEYTPTTDGTVSVTGVKYLYYLGEKRNANWTTAKDTCEEKGGKLTTDIDIDDWELLYGESNVFLDDNYFWIGLKRDANKNWFWLDDIPLDLNMTASFPLRPEFKDNITWDCVQWNVKEPFYVPQHCDVASPFICKIPGSVCAFKSQGKLKLNESDMITYDNASAVVINSSTGMPAFLALDKTKVECETACMNFDNPAGNECWLYEYHNTATTNKCKLVISDGKPVLVNLKSDPTVNLTSKYCVKVEKFTHCKDGEECICGNVTSPPTPEQLEEILEETKEKLTVPTKNLSSTIRKKTSAADDRPSSQTMGYFGITMITVTLGGLVLLDCTSMLRDLKIMIYNLKSMTSGNKDLPAPTTLQVNLQGGPKQSYA